MIKPQKATPSEYFIGAHCIALFHPVSAKNQNRSITEWHDEPSWGQIASDRADGRMRKTIYFASILQSQNSFEHFEKFNQRKCFECNFSFSAS